MKDRITISLLLVLGIFLCACTPEKTMHTITLVKYSIDSGPILPERQWYEEITITQTGVVLKRNGKVAETKVNAGTWNIPVNRVSTSEFLNELEGVDWSSLERLESADAPDGAGTISFEFVFSNGKSQSLYYDPGTTYRRDARLRKRIDDFILQLEIPFGAKNRYLEDY